MVGHLPSLERVVGHPNNLVNAMMLVGYSLTDMLSAYPGKDEAYLNQLLRDNALHLSRPVLPYGLLGTHPCKSRFFNIHKFGFRLNGSSQPWPPNPHRTNIFFFGGSTTAGANVEDCQTIPACLQRSLDLAGKHCEIYNFGSASYKSRHEVMRFISLVDLGFVPDCVIFLDGFNECFYAYRNYALVNILDSLYQAEKKRRRLSYLNSLTEFAVTSYRNRRNPLPVFQTYAPETEDEELAQYLSEAAIKAALRSSHRQLQVDEITGFHTKTAKLVWEHYLDSVALIRAMATHKDVKAFFVWQPVAYYKTAEEQRVMERLYLFHRYGVINFWVYNWLHLFEFPCMRDDHKFLNLSGVGESLDGKLYVDTCHYSAFFCEVIAQAMAAKLLAEL